MDNVDKVSDYDTLSFEICLLLKEYVPGSGVRVDREYSGHELAKMLKNFFTKYKQVGEFYCTYTSSGGLAKEQGLSLREIGA